VHGENIICFAKDWSESPTSNHHVMTELARKNRVVWLNSIATRTPAWRSRRDFRRIVRKVEEYRGGPRHEGGGLWSFSPLVVPLPSSRVAQLVNRQILRATIQRISKQLQMRDYQLWSFLPNVADYLDCCDPSLRVYYCVDEWSLFRELDGPRIAAAEQRLCREVDLVFAACEELVLRKRRLNPNTFLVPHGVDYELFARALEPTTVIPNELAALPRPHVGFFGTLADWVDTELLVELARHRPEWSIVLVGPIMADVSALRGPHNIHLLGARAHVELPAYCKGFDVGIIPYRLEERMRYVNPSKVREYLCAGLPVVATPVPEVGRLAGCAVATGPFEFEAAVARALDNDDAAARRARSESMANETWQRRVELISARVAAIKEGKWRRRSRTA
jgi:glycosyltransferase involved in cell wall biosynthesis